MERLILLVYNSIYFIINLKDEICYKYSLKNPIKSQERILKSILNRNRKTKFGINNSFDKISTIKDYQEKVAVSNYEDYLPYIGLIKKGEKDILTKSPVVRFCLSSGTSSSSKLIPFNRQLKREFQKAIAVWLNNILKNYPSVLFGKSFWIITPIAQTDYDDSKITIGFGEDSSYFGYLQKYLIQKVMAVPEEVCHLNDSENYYYAVSYFLIRQKNLRLISVWNPLVLLNIMKKIIQYHEQLIADIELGVILFPEKVSDKIEILFKKYLTPQPGEAIRLKQIFNGIDLNNQYSLLASELWPDMALISCWTDSWASRFINSISEFFPDIPIQGKGLLATEAIVTIPFKPANSTESVYLPAINSHFLDFKGVDDQEVYQIHQLKKNNRYEVIVTTGGGFYRYMLNDIVEVSGYYRNTPTLKFLGKSNMVCDVTGEKLNETHVSSVLERLRKEFCLKSMVTFISPFLAEAVPTYVLFVEYIDDMMVTSTNSSIVTRLDELLSENYHYKNSRALLQLGIPEVFVMKPEAVGLFLNFKSIHSKQGSIKVSSLDFKQDWTALLPGGFVKSKTQGYEEKNADSNARGGHS
jgi:hypothetical protein